MGSAFYLFVVCVFETGYHHVLQPDFDYIQATDYVALAGLEVTVTLLPAPPKC